jgi:uncharacterized repeat protein (TIGR01451 family)
MNLRSWRSLEALVLLLLHIQPGSAALVEQYGRLPLHFELNRGQADDTVQFVARGPGYTLALSATEARVALRRSPGFSLKLAEGNARARVLGQDPLPLRVNYLLGNDPSKWRTGIATFARVRIEQVYPGINLVYYGNQRELEFDFLVEPHADPERIRLRFAGAQNVQLSEAGDLVLESAGQSVRLKRPVMYQEMSGGKLEVAGGYVLRKNGRVGVRVGAYDRSKRLVIDPVLVYSTYLGGNGSDYGHAIAVDADGSAYVAGFTESSDFPAEGASSDSALGGTMDVFVTKLNPAGTALEYSTYLGGTGRDGAYGVAVDTNKNAYLMGFTESADFPTSNGAFDTSLGGTHDCFVTKLGPTGALVYSTYLGGSAIENQGAASGGIAVNNAGNAFVCGLTTSVDFPTTTGAYDRSMGGITDAFVTRLNANGSALVYSTYLGGSMHDFANAIALDASENVYVTGGTRSSNFPTTPGAYDQTFGGGTCFVNPVPCSDVFVSKLNASGSALLYSTFLGGAREDTGDGIAVNGSGEVVVTGEVNSDDFPVVNALYDTYRGGGDAFVTKLNNVGSAPVYSTYLGGLGLDQGYAIALDPSGNAYVGGYTSSAVFPTTPDGVSTNVMGFSDGFFARFNAMGTALDYSTFLGGDGGEYVFALALGPDRAVYLTGLTESTNFPTVAGGYSTTRSSFRDAYVTKFESVPEPPHVDLALAKTASPEPAIIGSNLTWTLAIANIGNLDAPGVTVTDALPARVTFVMALSSQGTCSNDAGTITCTMGTITGGQTGTVTIVATANTTGVITNRASVSTTDNDSNPANNTATAITAVTPPPPDLMPSKANEASVCSNGLIAGVFCSLSADLTLRNNEMPFATARLNFTALCKKCPAAVKWKLSGLLTMQTLDLTDVPDHGLTPYLSDDEAFDAGDTLLMKKPIGLTALAKASGSGKPVKLKAKVPAEVDLSGKFILLVEDAANLVTESDETNNVAAFGPIP